MTTLSPWAGARTPPPEPVRVPPHGAVILGRLRKIARVVMNGCDWDDQCEAISDCLLLASELGAAGVVPPDRFWIETLKVAGRKLHDERRGRLRIDTPEGADEAVLYDGWLYHLRRSTPAIQEANVSARQAVPRLARLSDDERAVVLARINGDSISQIAKARACPKKKVIALLKAAELCLKEEGPPIVRQPFCARLTEDLR